jgi:hypothetical protein
VPRMKDITNQLMRRLEKVSAPHTPWPYCECGGERQLATAEVAAESLLNGYLPGSRCLKCGGEFILVVVVESREISARLEELGYGYTAT